MNRKDTKISLVLGSHAHVPAGAAESAFEDAYEKTLRPFVSTLCRYPKMQAVLHYSGALLYWVERSHPELFMLIDDLVSHKQAELLGGGFYEPMLPLIPPQDRIGQIELLTTYLRRHFGKRPLGCWIPALAWEQHLVSPLAACGMSYTFLGEDQFRRAGFEGADLFSPCISEDQGKLITVFPIFQSVEAALAEKNVSVALEELRRRLPLEGERIVSIFPAKPSAAGEPPDYAWYRFFEELSLSESLVECVTPGKLLKGLKNPRKAAFPDSVGVTSRDERVTPRRFLIEHPEANGIYSKMIFTSVLINQLRGDKSRKQSAREELWKAQGCDLFYSLERGEGLYCHASRKAAYRSLIGAERITREKRKFSASLVQFDFDFDGTGEYLFQDTKLNCYIQSLGAGIFELDYLPKTWNYLDAGPRLNGQGGIVPAWGKRAAFADWLLPAAAAPDQPAAGDLLSRTEPARRCFAEKYEVQAFDRSKGALRFMLPAAAVPFGNIEIQKGFSIKKDILMVTYSIINRGNANETFNFVPEINLSFAGEGPEYVRLFTCNTGVKDALLDLPSGVGTRINGAEGLKIQDLKNEVQINLSSVRAFDGEAFLARIGEHYQSHCITPRFTISLGGGESWNTEFSLRFSH